MKEKCWEPVLKSDDFNLKARLCKPMHPKAAVLFAHGMCSDHKEIGIFTRIEKRLVDLGCVTLRFDFRGHGESRGGPEDISIKGEIEDLRNAFHLLRDYADGKAIGLIAASFGASVLLLSDPGDLQISTIVLLNPVTDFERTFLEPETPWGREYFGRRRILSGEPIQIEEDRLGCQFVRDLSHFEPRENVKKWNVPIFIIHGDRDEAIPYATSRRLAESNENVFLATIPGAGHGFDNAEKRRLVIELVKLWFFSRLLTE